MNANDIQAVNTLAKRQSMGKAIGIVILQTIKGIKDYAGHWAEYDIDIAVTNGVASGMSETEFKPD